MKRFILLLIYIVCCLSLGKAQTLSEFTVSSCSFNTEIITATLGETHISNSEVLSSGFIEVLLAEAKEISEEPSIDDPTTEEPETPEDPTELEQIEKSVRIKATNHLLQINCSNSYLLTIYNISGSMILKENIDSNYKVHLPTGIYIVILENATDRVLYKINIQ